MPLTDHRLTRTALLAPVQAQIPAVADAENEIADGVPCVL